MYLFAVAQAYTVDLRADISKLACMLSRSSLARYRVATNNQ